MNNISIGDTVSNLCHHIYQESFNIDKWKIWYKISSRIIDTKQHGLYNRLCANLIQFIYYNNIL